MDQSSQYSPNLRLTRTKIVFAGLVAAAFFIPIPSYGPLFDRALNAGHLYVFAALAVVVMRRFRAFPLGKRVWVTMMTCATTGLAIEVLQPVFSRRMSLADFWIDLFGAVIGVGLAIGMTLTSANGKAAMVFGSLVALIIGSYVIIAV